MPVPPLLRPATYAVVTICLVSTVLGGAVVPAGAVALSARASVTPGFQYVGDSDGTTFSFTIENTGTSDSIGAVEIGRPGKSWTITACPSAPDGWTAQRSDTMCRYRSAASTADDVAPGEESPDFQVRATTPAGRQDLSGTWPVKVSRKSSFDKPSVLVAAAATPPGLAVTAHSFEVLDVVIDPENTTPGAPCPSAHRSAGSATTHTLVVCGRNRTTTALTPTAARSSLTGTFVHSALGFTSGPIAPTTSSRILGSWEDVTIASAPGDDKTVIARIGSATHRTSPLTTLEDYEVTGAANAAPVAVDDEATVAEDDGTTTVDVLGNDTDADGDTLSVSGLDTTGTEGTVTDNGTDVSYDPDGAFDSLDAGETATDRFDYTVSDGHGGTDTGVVAITVTGVNDAPVIAGIEPGPLAYTENAAATPVTATGTVVDVDSDDLATGTLTVRFSAGGQAEDRLSIVGGTTPVGTVVGGTNGSTPLVITLNASATPGAVQALLRSVTYRNVSDNPSTAARTVQFVLTDGDGGTSTPGTRGVSVSPVDDPPVAVDDEAVVAQNAAPTGILVLLNDTDVDAGAKTIASAGNPTHGTVVLTGGTPGAHTGLTYEPDPGYCNTPPGTVLDTFTYTLNGGSTATVSVTVNCSVNAPPVADDDTATVGEDAGATIIPVLVGDTDADGDSLAVTGLDVTGTDGLVTNNGTDVSYDPNGAFESLGAGQTATDTFTYTVSDGHGGTDTALVTVTVTGVNDAPVIAGIELAALAYTENAAPTPITATGTVVDVDSANLATGTLTVSFTAGGAAEDRLAIAGGTTIGTAVGGTNGSTPLVITLNATATPAAVKALLRTVTYANVSNDPSTAARTVRFVLTDGDGGTSAPVTRGITVSAVDDAPTAVNDVATVPQDSSATGILVLTNDTDVDGGAMLIASASDPTHGTVVLTGGTAGARTGLTYTPDAGYCNTLPGTLPDTFTYTLHGGSTATVSVTVTCLVNGAPVIAAVEGTALVVAEGDPFTVITATGTVTDADSANFAGGTLTVDFAPGVQPADQLGIRNQGLAVGEIGVAGSNVTYGGTTIGVFAGGLVGPLVVTLNASATPAAVQVLLRNITYRSLSDTPAPSRTARFILTDGDGGTSNAATRAITVTPVNDPPILLMGDPGALAYNAGDPATVITPNSSVTDPDSVNFDTGSLVVDYSSGGAAEDRFEIRNQGTGAGQIGVSGANVTHGGTTVGTFSGGSGTTPLVVTFNANATPTVAQAVLRAITYRNVAASPVTTNRVARFVMADGDGGVSGPVQRTITVTAPAAPPVVTTSAGTTAYTENGAALVVDAAVTVTDSDSANLTGATVQITGGFVSAEDVLSLTPPAGITPSYDATTGRLTLTGPALVATYQTALRGVRYSNSSDNPATANRIVTFIADDGTAASNSATRTVSVAAVNDPPMVGLDGAVLAYTENAGPTPIAVVGSVTDPDSADFALGTYTADFSVGGQAEDRLAIRNQGVAAGQIGVSGTNVTHGGVLIGTFVGGTNGSTPLVVSLNASATPVAVQALHRNVTYQNVSQNPVTAARTVRVVVSDGDGGTSGAAVRTITITAVNDAPGVSPFEAGALAYTENAAPTPITATMTVTDVDSANVDTGTLTVDFSAGGLAEDRLAIRNQGTGTGQVGVSGSNVSLSNVTVGTVTGGTNGTPLVVTFNASATAATIQAVVRNVTYANVSENPSTASRTVRAVVTDGDGGTSAARTRTVTVTAVDDAPVVATSAGSTAYTEQAPAVTVDPGLLLTDVDAGDVTGATVTVVSPIAGDTLHFTTQGTITGVFASNVLTLSGTATLVQYQAALRTVQFSNATSEAPGATRTIGFRITTPVASNTANKTIAITQVNDPPVVNVGAASPLAYAEQAAFTAIAPAGTVVDPDSATLASLTVTVTAGRSLLDTLRIDPVTTGFTSNYNSATGVLTLTRAGGTVAEYQAALRTVQFRNTSDDPDNRNDGTPNPTDANRTLSVVVNDGTASSAPVTRGVTITPVNDAPSGPGPLPTVDGIRNTTIVAGSLTTTDPHVTRTVNLIGASVDPDGLESAIAVVPQTNVPTLANGRFTVVADGGLRYEPPANASSSPAEQVGYRLTDGSAQSSLVSVSFTLSGAVWYVADESPLPRDGTAARPFDTVAAALAAAGSNVPVHIRRGAGDGSIPGSAVLAPGDRLLGAGVALTNVDVGTATVETLFPAGTRPVLTASGADVITLAQAATVQGVSINADGAANGLSGVSVNGIVLRSMDVTDTGVAATQPGVDLSGVNSGVNFSAPFTISTTQAGAISAANTTLNGTIASTTVTGSTLSPGINLVNTTGGLTFTNVAVSTTGQPGVVLTNAGSIIFPAAGAVQVTTTGAKALDASSTNLGNSVFDALTVTGSSSGGVRLSNVAGAPRLGDGAGTDLSLQTTSGSTPALDVAGSDLVTVDGNGIDTISATGGPGVDIRNSNGSTYVFDTVMSTNSVGDGINLDTNLSSTFTTSVGAISGATGIAVDVNGAAGDVTYGGTIADGTGQSVEVTGRTGGAVVLSGNIADGADVGGGIVVNGNAAGTTTFTGVSKVLNTGTGHAVVLSNNGAMTTGHLVSFANGGLDIDTTSGQGLAATTGQLTVSGTGNSITTSAGTALSIAGTTITAAEVTFQSISANGAPSGIVLNNTGTSGGLNVTGTGVVPSGGQILNSTGPGVSLTNTAGPSFNNLRIAGANRSGVQGVGVHGFTFTNGAIFQAGDIAVDDNDSSIAFNTTSGGQNNNVDGVVTITGNSLTGAYGGGVDIFNYAGTITNANISNNQVSSSSDPALSRRSGIALNLFGSATTVASLTTATIANNTVTGFPSGDGISIQGANTASSTAPAGTYGTPGGAPVTITGNLVSGDATNKINGFGISASVTGRGQGNFVITNNGTAGNPLRNMKSSAIAIGAAGSVTTYFTVTGNQISANNGFSSAGLALGTDKNIQADLSVLASPVVRATITNNSISNTSGSGVRVLHRDSNGSLDLRLENNTITNVLGNLAGIRVENGSSGNATYSSTLCASIANNDAASGAVDGSGDKNAGINLYKASALATTYKFGLTGLTPSPATNPQVEAHLTTLNPLSATGLGFFAGKKVAVRTGSNYTGCVLPSGV